MKFDLGSDENPQQPCINPAETCHTLLYLNSRKYAGAAYQGVAAPEVCLLGMLTDYQVIYYR